MKKLLLLILVCVGSYYAYSYYETIDGRYCFDRYAKAMANDFSQAIPMYDDNAKVTWSYMFPNGSEQARQFTGKFFKTTLVGNAKDAGNVLELEEARKSGEPTGYQLIFATWTTKVNRATPVIVGLSFSRNGNSCTIHEASFIMPSSLMPKN